MSANASGQSFIYDTVGNIPASKGNAAVIPFGARIITENPISFSTTGESQSNFSITRNDGTYYYVSYVM